MRSILDVKALLRRFGIVVYVGSKKDDLLMMEMELDDLWAEGLISRDEYVQAKAVLRREGGDLARN
ncbi:MAG: YqgQ family protein [Alicyclobacillaceae bacterium]|nr:YqgQ family protein [Alicyclobacillaceae bacterium]